VSKEQQKQGNSRGARARERVTQADLGRVATFLEAMGAKVAAVDVLPGRMKILTTDGHNLNLDADEEELDRELHNYRQQRGEGTS
jgi:hypothetical protein